MAPKTPIKYGRHYIVERQWGYKGNRYPLKDEIHITATSMKVAIRKATDTPMKGFRQEAGASVFIKIFVGGKIQPDISVATEEKEKEGTSNG